MVNMEPTESTISASKRPNDISANVYLNRPVSHMSFMAGSKRADQKRKLVASAKQRSMLIKNKQHNRVRTASNITRQVVKTVTQSN